MNCSANAVQVFGSLLILVPKSYKFVRLPMKTSLTYTLEFLNKAFLEEEFFY